jgi:hypothetical protein
MSNPSKTIAFFGATGDSAGYCLANCLKANYACSALARTPSKLTASMKAKGVDSAILDKNLTIVQGDVRDTEAVKQTLQRSSGKVADVMVVGIGAYPVFNWSFREPFVQQDPTVCQDAGKTILKALQEMKATTVSGGKPLMVNVSTTGIPTKGKPWDVPWWFSWLYRVLLHNAHVDKIVLQEHLADHVQLPENEKVISGYINAKASLLMDGEALGVEKVREGSEDTPVIGYTIRRADVGGWIFERLIKQEPRQDYMNKGVTITY